MSAVMYRKLLAPVLLATLALQAQGADLVALSPQTIDRFLPQGKEVDGIFGDFALANDQLVAVIAQPKRGRNANMGVREVGGSLIDLTRRDLQSDQLSAFYPGAQLRELKFAGIEVEAPKVYEAAELDRVFVQARRVTLKLVATPREKEPDVEVSYTLEDGWPSVLVTTTFSNRGATPIDADLLDAIRADHSFESSPEAPAPLFWAYDKYFGQAYGVVAEGHEILAANARRLLLRYRDQDGKTTVRIAPGASYRFARRVIPGANLFDVRHVANQLAGSKDRPVRLTVKDEAGRPVAAADVALALSGKPYAWGRTDDKGEVLLTATQEPGELTVSALGHGSKKVTLAPDSPESLVVEMPAAATVVARITDADGQAIPCKVQFIGRDETKSPDFGPDSGEHAVKNAYYSHDGRFRRDLEPGSYDVIVSYGPEHDAVFTKLEAKRGQETLLEAKLVRSVKTDGWISSDFHSHSSPSGDNTGSQFGRVLNLLCEQIDFAPCTEHNRLSTYEPHLKRLGAERRMATCVGMELTGLPLPLNHQNAFPLILRPYTQDNGGPTTDTDPEIQIERLALWDGGSDKLVQANHPDMGWMFHDRNGDGTVDTGFAAMRGKMDVVEVHPLATIFGEPTDRAGGVTRNNRVVNWLQLLNQGLRIPGTVNTDAHYNFHGSGFLRNYLRSPTDDPAEIRTLDIVHTAERGNLVMTSGPFLEVELLAGGSSGTAAIPGNDLSAPGGEATLKVRVQCPNWFDVDRVQVFLNGRPSETLNFTRENSTGRFSEQVMKFDQEIPLRLERDTHVVVAAIGEKSTLGPVMGPTHAKDKPVAVSNPIFVDVDGGGFKPNGDLLGGLPVKAGR
ncbi:CehA/McbA family metallohydrolase [Singulisphaera sp. Ch08]|uniref:CehA/McbA family metallohydrolase n=1 Tax=Singulisphaera sp. Ch08 TaxID=3120278 RepID=A0AAU7CLT5_9BACT